MTTFYIVRHCEAEGNIQKRMHGTFDSDITAKGKQQLEYLKKRMENVNIDAIYSSPLSRAYKTAKVISDNHNLPIITDIRLCERAIGKFEDCTWHQLKQLYPKEFYDWRQDLPNYVIEGGESEKMSVARFKDILFDIAKNYDGKTVLIASHSMVMKSLFESLFGKELPYSDNTAVSKLKISSQTKEIQAEFLNDNSHLPEGLSSLGKEIWWKSSGNLDSYSIVYEYGYNSFTSSIFGKTEQKEFINKNIISGKLYTGEYIGAAVYEISGKKCEMLYLHMLPQFQKLGYATQILGQIQINSRIVGAEQIVIKNEDPSIEFLAFSRKNSLQAVGNEYLKGVSPKRVLSI
ncbi:MAG: histidine phosphatase family protein [Oscillospiraceae bacterium]